jgi:hypothetical protein
MNEIGTGKYEFVKLTEFAFTESDWHTPIYIHILHGSQIHLTAIATAISQPNSLNLPIVPFVLFPSSSVLSFPPGLLRGNCFLHVPFGKGIKQARKSFLRIKVKVKQIEFWNGE